MPELIEILKVAIIAYVFILLTEDKMIFAWYGRLIDRIKSDWLYKPLGGCLACFSGQVAAWYYLFTHIQIDFKNGEWYYLFARFTSYNLFDHIWFVSAVILTVLIIDKIMTYDT